MKKTELVKKIMAQERGYKEDGLLSMKMSELWFVFKNPEEPEAEEQEESTPGPEALENTLKPRPEAEPEPEPEHISLCGHKFDPSESASCFTMCQNDEPEAYAACLAHFKTLKIEPKAKAKSKTKGAGSNVWFHQSSSQGGQIDAIFFEGKSMTMEEICTWVGGTAARVKSHIGHLKADWKLDLRIDENKRYFWAETNKSKGTPIAGKTAYTGTKARPAYLPSN